MWGILQMKKHLPRKFINQLMLLVDGKIPLGEFYDLVAYIEKYLPERSIKVAPKSKK